MRSPLTAVLLLLAASVPLAGDIRQTTFAGPPTWVYDFVPISLPGADYTGLEGINNRNEVVAHATFGSNIVSFVLGNGTITPLAIPGATATFARDISDTGEVVGFCDRCVAGNDLRHGWRRSAEGAFTVGQFEPPIGLLKGSADGIDAHGRVAGWFEIAEIVGLDPGPIQVAVRYASYEGFTARGVTLTGTNDAGHLVGWADRTNADPAPFLFASTVVPITGPPDAAGPVTPDDVNNHDTVVGSYTQAGSFQTSGFVWQNGKAARVSYPGAYRTELTGLNDQGVLVGRAALSLSGSIGFVAWPRSPVRLTMNGSAGAVDLDRGQPLRLDLAFIAPSTGPLAPAELYVGVLTSSGAFWLNAAGMLVPTPTRAYTGPLGDIGPAAVLDVPSASWLPPGTYTWFAIVDDDANGVPNGAFYDTVRVTLR